MEKLKIVKVKLIKEGAKLRVIYRESDHVKSLDDKTCDNAVHPDMIKAINGLKVHLAILTDYIPEKNSSDNKELEKFHVTGYSVGGKEDSPGFVITGYRDTGFGTVTLNSPFTLFEQEAASQYKLIGDVQKVIAKINKEVIAYLFTGKQAQAQLELPEGKENGTKKAAKTELEAV